MGNTPSIPADRDENLPPFPRRLYDSSRTLVPREQEPMPRYQSPSYRNMYNLRSRPTAGDEQLPTISRRPYDFSPTLMPNEQNPMPGSGFVQQGLQSGWRDMNTRYYETSNLRDSPVPDLPGYAQKRKPKTMTTTPLSRTEQQVMDDEEYARQLQEEYLTEMHRQEREVLPARNLEGGTEPADIRRPSNMTRMLDRRHTELRSSTATTRSSTSRERDPQAAQNRTIPLDRAHDHPLERRRHHRSFSQHISVQDFPHRRNEGATRADWDDFLESQAEAKRLQDEINREFYEQQIRKMDSEKANNKNTNTENCIACGDEQDRKEMFHPCKHFYCRECLKDGFQFAVRNKNLFRCCGRSHRMTEGLGLDKTSMDIYAETYLELTTKNPLFCSNVRCSKLLPETTAFAGEIVTCMHCQTKTCKQCKNQAHPGAECQEDKEITAVKQLAVQKGWKACPGCEQLVEKTEGCSHITCPRCGTDFCYRCARKWEDCCGSCPRQAGHGPVSELSDGSGDSDY